VGASGIAFGGYDPFVAPNVDSVGNISVTCDVATTYSIALSPGSGSYDSRVMTSGIHELLYNLYIDATLTTVWGDGTGHSATVGATQSTAHHIVYGRIPAGQNAHVGVYSDTIVITLTF
jgi:spore coat protein U-like protein